jgi:ribosome biogenesis GTPase
MRGIIIRSQSGFYTVQAESGQIVCQLRGRLKQGSRTGDIAAVGDWVQVTSIDEETGMIEEIEPRRRAFVRMAPLPQGEYQQILLANPDQVALVFACAEPSPRFGMLDRYLVIAEEQGVPPMIVANKIDLVGAEAAREMYELYADLGYPLVYTSAKTGDGVENLHQALTGKVSLLTGPSGVGKSSLLNAMQPGLGLEVRRVSQTTSKGRHTTVFREMYPLEGGGYVVDTPGLKALALWDIEPEELDGYFPELRPLVEGCTFSDCTHVHEPGCAVIDAVEAGEVDLRRYESYLRMRYGEGE